MSRRAQGDGRGVLEARARLRARMRGQRGLAGRVVRGPLAISFAGAVLKQEFNRFLRLYARPRRYGFH